MARLSTKRIMARLDARRIVAHGLTALWPKTHLLRRCALEHEPFSPYEFLESGCKSPMFDAHGDDLECCQQSLCMSTTNQLHRKVFELNGKVEKDGGWFKHKT